MSGRNRWRPILWATWKWQTKPLPKNNLLEERGDSPGAQIHCRLNQGPSPHRKALKGTYDQLFKNAEVQAETKGTGTKPPAPNLNVNLPKDRYNIQHISINISCINYTLNSKTAWLPWKTTKQTSQTGQKRETFSYNTSLAETIKKQGLIDWNIHIYLSLTMQTSKKYTTQKA